MSPEKSSELGPGAEEDRCGVVTVRAQLPGKPPKNGARQSPNRSRPSIKATSLRDHRRNRQDGRRSV